MNVNKPNSFINTNKINNTNQKYKYNNNIQHLISQKVPFAKNIYQSDKKLKSSNSPYYTVHKKIASDIISTESQKLLLLRELEIKDLKMKCEKLEQENHKYQIQNILLKNNFNNNCLNLLSNNTSSNFPIRNEIKKLWEKFAKVDLLNNFIEFENEPEKIYHLICELILLSDKMIKEHCTLKYQEILKIMGVKNNSVIIKDIETQFKNFMKEHLNEIFNYLQDKSFINDYKKQFKIIVKNTVLCINESNMAIIEDILEQYEFNDMLKNINDIILFTQFNEPTLYFQIESKYENRKVKYLKINNENKKEYIIINNQGNKIGYTNNIVLLEPPCIKSGYIFYNELKPILIAINKEIEEDKCNLDIINTEYKKLNKDELLSIRQNNTNKDKKTIDEEIKFYSINNSSRINRNLNLDIINNKKDKENNFMNFYTNNNYKSNNKKFCKNNYKNNNKIANYDYHKFTLDKDSCYEENKKIKKIISINSCRATGKKIKKKKKLSISKDINSEENDFCSTDENKYIESNKCKETIISNNSLNKKYNKIHRIKSANNYFDKNKNKINKEKNKFFKRKNDIIKKEGSLKENNNHKDNINNIINNNRNSSKKNIYTKSSDGNHSLSKGKKIQKPLTFKKNKKIKNKILINNNFSSTSNNKTNYPINARKVHILNNIKNPKSFNNNRTLKNSKTKMNIKINNYQNRILMMNKIINKAIISPTKIKKTKKNKENIKENLLYEEENKEKNVYKNLNIKRGKNKVKGIKNNYSNSNLLNNNDNINIHYSNLSTNRTKLSAKALDLNDQKNSFAFSTLEEIKKLMDEGNRTHKPIIMISTNSNINNNHTININRQLKIKNHIFNKKNKNIRNNINYNTINNSIKQLISLSQPKNVDNTNINNNYNIYINNKSNKINIKSLETINISGSNNKNKYVKNRGLYCKQFSIDETTFNTSSQFNLTHDYNNKSNNTIKNYIQFIKMPKHKQNKTLPNEVKIKCKSTNSNNNVNINYNINKNRIREIQINIEGLNNNNNFNTINAQPNIKRYHNFFHSYENSKNE